MRNNLPENPYEAAPNVKDASLVLDSSPKDASWLSMLLTIFLGWERWRLGYNALLGGPVFFLTFTQLPDLAVVSVLVRGAIVANVCYFAGPIAESMLCMIGIRGQPVRWCLFGMGTLCMLFLTGVVLSGSLLPDQD